VSGRRRLLLLLLLSGSHGDGLFGIGLDDHILDDSLLLLVKHLSEVLVQRGLFGL
jgi:hypothetical protein